MSLFIIPFCSEFFFVNENNIGDVFTASKERPLKMIELSKKLLVERPIEPDFKSSQWGDSFLP